MILHADIDAFFASVEQRDDPSLRGVPMAVAAQVICCASYEARGLGVRAGMPIRHALRCCPDLVMVGLRPEAYQSASEAIFELFARYAHRVEPGSMEEAFLDVGHHRDAELVARSLRHDVRTELGLPLSVGVARTKLLAKVSSRRAKPDGLVVVTPAEEHELRRGLRIDELWGVGPATAARLAQVGIGRVADLEGIDLPTMREVVGRNMAGRLVAIAAGTEDDVVRPAKPRQSVSCSRTVSPATRSASTVDALLDDLLGTLAGRMAAAEAAAASVEVTVRFDDRAVVLRRKRLDTPLWAGSAVAEPARRLLAETGFAEDGRGVTGVGVGVALTRVSEACGSSQLALPIAAE